MTRDSIINFFREWQQAEIRRVGSVEARREAIAIIGSIAADILTADGDRGGDLALAVLFNDAAAKTQAELESRRSALRPHPLTGDTTSGT